MMSEFLNKVLPETGDKEIDMEVYCLRRNYNLDVHVKRILSYKTKHFFKNDENHYMYFIYYPIGNNKYIQNIKTSKEYEIIQLRSFYDKKCVLDFLMGIQYGLNFKY